MPRRLILAGIGPHTTAVQLNGTRVLLPAALSFRSLSLWLKTDPGSLPDPNGRFLFDLRAPDGSGPALIIWTGEPLYTYGIQDFYVNGVRVPSSGSLSALATNDWCRVDVVLTESATANGTLFGRFAPVGSNFFSWGNSVATLTLFRSPLTSAQVQADPTATAPDGDVLAQYTWRGITGTTLPDVSGHGYAATLLNDSTTITGPSA